MQIIAVEGNQQQPNIWTSQN